MTLWVPKPFLKNRKALGYGRDAASFHVFSHSFPVPFYSQVHTEPWGHGDEWQKLNPSLEGLGAAGDTALPWQWKGGSHPCCSPGSGQAAVGAAEEAREGIWVGSSLGLRRLPESMGVREADA